MSDQEQPFSPPNHLGLILDGNRRWAKSKGKTVAEGHRRGYMNFVDIVNYCSDLGINFLSAYVFSTENWQRSKNEVDDLMKLANRIFLKETNDYHDNNIKVVVLGSKQNLTSEMIESIGKVESKTANNNGLTLALCFNYGGANEIVEATKEIITDNIASEDIDQQLFERYLYHPEVPSLDMIIRTSGEKRLSGFMQYRAQYAELFFSEKMWPEFTDQDLKEMLEQYQQRKRRFGK